MSRNLLATGGQVDRFMLKVVIGYPSREEEKQIIRQNIFELHSPTSRSLLQDTGRAIVRGLHYEKISKYIVDIAATRFPDQYGMRPRMIGFTPRASINLALCMRLAFIKRRGYVIPEIRAVSRRAPPPHRSLGRPTI